MLRDLRYAIRGLLAQPAFTCTAIVTLALAVGVNATMLDVLDRLLLRPPFGVSEPDRVTRLYFAFEGGGAMADTSEAVFLDLERALTGKAAALATFDLEKLTLGRAEKARPLQVVNYSTGYFDVLGLKPAIGLLPGRRTATGSNAAVISHGLWQQQYGGRTDIVGRPLDLGTQVFTIVGVTEPGFTGIDADPTDVWLPMEARGPLRYGDQWKTNDSLIEQRIIVRLNPRMARAEFEAIATAAYQHRNGSDWLRKLHVVAGDLNLGRGPNGNPDINVATWIGGVSLLVLIIGCGNVASLVLLRGITRSQEFAVKAALGARRSRLAREVLTEAWLLALGAGALAVALVNWADQIVPRFFSNQTGMIGRGLDLRLAGVTAAVSLLAALLLAAIPVLRLFVIDSPLPGRHGMHKGHSYALDGLLALQVALTVPLLVGAGLFAGSFRLARDHQRQFGLEVNRIAVVRTNLFEIGEPGRNRQVHRELQRSLSRVPGVEAAALVSDLPLKGGRGYFVTAPGESVTAGSVTSPWGAAVDPSYQRIVGVEILQGRALRDDDNHAGASPVAVISEGMARDYWHGKPALGRCFTISAGGTGCFEVVGIMRDVPTSVEGKPDDAYLVAIDAAPPFLSFESVLLRTTGDATSSLDVIRRAAIATSSNLPYVDVWAFEDLLQPWLRQWRLGASMFAAFGLLAMVISGIGLAGTIAYSVTRRRRELGVRKALGAQSADLVRVVLRRSVAVVLMGVVVGLVGAYAGANAMKALLFGVQPNDWRVFVGAGVALLAVAGAAALLPARRATTVNPVELLRSE